MASVRAPAIPCCANSYAAAFRIAARLSSGCPRVPIRRGRTGRRCRIKRGILRSLINQLVRLYTWGVLLQSIFAPHRPLSSSACHPERGFCFAKCKAKTQSQDLLSPASPPAETGVLSFFVPCLRVLIAFPSSLLPEGESRETSLS